MAIYASNDMENDRGLVAQIGERMRKVRERAGLTQEHVARRMGAGIDQPRISKWEKGLMQPSLTQLFRFAEICGAAAEELVADIQRPLARFQPLFAELDPPATRVVTRMVDLLRERARMLRERRRGRASGG